MAGRHRPAGGTPLVRGTSERRGARACSPGGWLWSDVYLVVPLLARKGRAHAARHGVVDRESAPVLALAAAFREQRSPGVTGLIPAGGSAHPSRALAPSTRRAAARVATCRTRPGPC